MADVREEKKKATKRKKNKTKTIIISIFIAFMAVVLAFASTFFLFQTTDIEINPTEKYSVEDISKTLSDEYGSNLLFLDTGYLEDKLTASFPYVERVEVGKSFPSTLQITLIEEDPKYSFEYENDYVLVSDDGKLMEKTTYPLPNTIIVSIGDILDYEGYIQIGTTEKHDALYQTMRFIKTSLITDITNINYSDPYSMQIVYDNRIRLELGDSTDIEYKLEVGFQILASQRIESNVTGQIDLSTVRETDRAYFLADSDTIVDTTIENSDDSAESSTVITE